MSLGHNAAKVHLSLVRIDNVDIDVCADICAVSGRYSADPGLSVIGNFQLNAIAFLCSGQLNLVDKLAVLNFEILVANVGGAVRVKFKRRGRQLTFLAGIRVIIPELQRRADLAGRIVAGLSGIVARVCLDTVLRAGS